jgi:hypothetical protein
VQRRDLPREFVTNHLDADLFAHLEPKVAHKVLINPWFKLAHPVEFCQQRYLLCAVSRVS